MENTPFYFYDLNVLDDTLNTVLNCTESDNFHIHYAIKANNNKKILEIIAAKGFGADCVSGWEIEASISAGFKPSSIAFAGVGKTDDEIAIALTNRIGMIHCESLEEILVINEMADSMNYIPKIALRLNPNVSALTHEKISTGLSENKFGLTVLEFAELVTIHPSLRNINIVGMHFHIGSQIIEMSVFEQLCERINEIVPQYENTIGKIEYLNVGGGLGANYDNPDQGIIPEFEAYFDTFRWGLRKLNVPVHFELGRSIVAQCGSLHTKVLYVKKSESKNFAVLDAGMTELMRPALYGAKHKIEKLNQEDGLFGELTYDIVGPICESSDSFGSNVILPELRRGDILSIRSCGAYAESMSLRYNGRKEVGNNLKRQVNTSLRLVRTA
ncbi:MAG: diaminopimelate decarboxylase [Crocinitomix sp.]|nr:diaminopimelate decarboxylase [Crocinitomix sp.]